MRRALILGIGGQDGSYLAELLLSKGYEVHGLHRRSSVDNLWRLGGIRSRVKLYQGDLLDIQSVIHAIAMFDPDEIYNEADQDDIRWSKRIPTYSFQVTAAAVGAMLEALIPFYNEKRIKFFQPLSCTMFGGQRPHTETSPLDPQSPFACAKAAAWHLCKFYRQTYNLDVRCGIMFNHDSPNRNADYVLQRICRSAVLIKAGKQKELKLGNLEQRLDIGFAGDYMDAAWRIMQLKEPDDFVVATGTLTSIEHLAEMAFSEVGLPSREVRERYVSDANFGHRTLVTYCGDTQHLFRYTGWKPQTGIVDLVRMICEAERGTP